MDQARARLLNLDNDGVKSLHCSLNNWHLHKIFIQPVHGRNGLRLRLRGGFKLQFPTGSKRARHHGLQHFTFARGVVGGATSAFARAQSQLTIAHGNGNK